MELRRSVAGLWRQRQQTAGVERPQRQPAPSYLQPARGCREGDCLVSAQARTPSQWWWHPRQDDKILEHTAMSASPRGRNRESSVQPPLLEERERDSEHARLLSKPHLRLAVPHHEANGNPNRSYVPRVVSGGQSRRIDTGYGGGRRDPALLEDFPV